MGILIPLMVAESCLSHLLAGNGLQRISQGKVRDTYGLPDHSEYLLVVATDRISIFDFVLLALVKRKGEVLTAKTIFWLTEVLKGFQHHLIAYGEAIDPYLPAALRGNAELQSRALIVKKLEIIPVECVVRRHLTGSGWTSYQKDGTVCGIKLPEGLQDGSELPESIFTPTTKAESGHDLPLSEDEVIKRYGLWIKEKSLEIFEKAYDFAKKRGIIIADTKFEFGVGEILADEVLTPDSSRLWNPNALKKAIIMGKPPSGWDKQPVRDWGKTVQTPFEPPYNLGINNLKPEIPEHVVFVHELTVPPEVLESTTNRYKGIFHKLTDFSLDGFLVAEMGIRHH